VLLEGLSKYYISAPNRRSHLEVLFGHYVSAPNTRSQCCSTKFYGLIKCFGHTGDQPTRVPLVGGPGPIM